MKPSTCSSRPLVSPKKTLKKKKTRFFFYSQGKLTDFAKKIEISEMMANATFYTKFGPLNSILMLFQWFKVKFTPYGPLKDNNLEKTVFFKVNCLGFLYMKFYIINVVIFLNYLFSSTKCFLNHYSKFFGFWVMHFQKKYFFPKIPPDPLKFNLNMAISSERKNILRHSFFNFLCHSKILSHAANHFFMAIPVFL